MYLSRIFLDTSKRRTMIALTSPNLIHGAIESSFSGGRARNLWRIDTFRGERVLLILSAEKADFSGISEQFGRDDIPVETKDYSPLLNRIENGQTWQFRLCANPTIASKPNGGDRGKVLAHITTEHQSEWLLRRAEKHGFSLSPDDFLVTGSKWYDFRKGDKNRVRLLSVTYEGILTVTDKESFIELLTNGIGKGKAYGMGLFTIARAIQS